MPLARILSGEPFSRRSPPEARGYANQVESIVSLRPERTLLPRVSKSPSKRAAPAAAAPAPKKQKESQARHAFAVGERVQAHWDEKWWPAVVHGLEDDGSYEVHWDGDGRYDYVAADAVRAVPWSASGVLGRFFGK